MKTTNRGNILRIAIGMLTILLMSNGAVALSSTDGLIVIWWDSTISKEKFGILDITTGNVNTLGQVGDLAWWSGQSTISNNILYVIGSNNAKQWKLYSLDTTSGSLINSVNLLDSSYYIAGPITTTPTPAPVNRPPNKPKNLQQFKWIESESVWRPFDIVGIVDASIIGFSADADSNVPDPDEDRVKLEIYYKRDGAEKGETVYSSLGLSSDWWRFSILKASGLKDGRYEWKARIVDEYGAESDWAKS